MPVFKTRKMKNLRTSQRKTVMLSLEEEYETTAGGKVELHHVMTHAITGIEQLKPVYCGIYWNSLDTPRPAMWDEFGDPVNSLLTTPSIRPKPKEYEYTVWINIYPGPPKTTESYHKTRERADRYAMPQRIACVKMDIAYKEGDGLAELNKKDLT